MVFRCYNSLVFSESLAYTISPPRCQGGTQFFCHHGPLLSLSLRAKRGNPIRQTPNAVVVRPFNVVQSHPGTRLKPCTTFFALCFVNLIFTTSLLLLSLRAKRGNLIPRRDCFGPINRASQRQKGGGFARWGGYKKSGDPGLPGVTAKSFTGLPPWLCSLYYITLLYPPIHN